MFLDIILSILTILISVFVLTGLKLAIYRMFSFLNDKKVWVSYLIFHSILIVVTVILIIIFWDLGTKPIVLYVLLPILTVFGFIEYFYFYTKHFDYESKGRYILSLLVSYLANFMAFNVLFYLFLTLLLVLSGISS